MTLNAARPLQPFEDDDLQISAATFHVAGEALPIAETDGAFFKRQFVDPKGTNRLRGGIGDVGSANQFRGPRPDGRLPMFPQPRWDCAASNATAVLALVLKYAKSRRSDRNPGRVR